MGDKLTVWLGNAQETVDGGGFVFDLDEWDYSIPALHFQNLMGNPSPFPYLEIRKKQKETGGTQYLSGEYYRFFGTFAYHVKPAEKTKNSIKATDDTPIHEDIST